ncbi:hypothetical protein [Lactococcus petauri]|uniref:hypothetical protein n=1 Tax=Lactococcus petauri TaxID=1940789 RepID=UPI0038542E6A
MCNCYSYNAVCGEDKETELKAPVIGKSIFVDACIAKVIQHLWDNDIWTESSCCGHIGADNRPEYWGSAGPSIVLGSTVDNYSRVRELIAEVEDRRFELSQWKRVVV